MAHHNSHTVPMDTICLSLNQQNNLAAFTGSGKGELKRNWQFRFFLFQTLPRFQLHLNMLSR
jgi:hypothetical protein